MQKDKDTYYDRLLYESKLAKGIFPDDPKCSGCPSADAMNRELAYLDKIQELQAELSKVQLGNRVAQDESMVILQQNLQKSLDANLAKDEANMALMHELRMLREQNAELAEKLQMQIDQFSCLHKSIELDKKSQRDKDAQIASLSSQLAEALQKNSVLSESSRLNKKHLYGSSTQKGVKQKTDKSKDRNQEKDDFDGTPGSGNNDQSSCCQGESNITTSQNSEDSAKIKKKPVRPSRYNKMNAARVVEHMCDIHNLPEGYKFIKFRTLKEFTHVSYIQEDRYQVAIVKTPEDKLVDYYVPRDKSDTSYPREQVVSGTHITPELLSEMIVNKFQYHLPINRQDSIYKNLKAMFSQQTISNYYDKGFKKLNYLKSWLISKILTKGSFLHCDETWVKVRVEKNGVSQIVKKYLWCLVNEKEKLTYFFYDSGKRSREVILNLLEGFEGSLQTDCYSAYKYFDRENSDIDHIVCMAHVRAKFKYAQSSDDRATWFLEQIGKLYGIEKKNVQLNRTNQEIEHYRKRYSLPILERIHKRAQSLFRKEKNQVGSLMYKALNYLLNCYTELKKYVNQGYYTIDNSQAERSIRPVTVGRKNYGHFGSERSAKIAALYYSLIETCKMRGANVKDYFTNFFRLEKQGMTDYANMLPGLI